MADLAGAFGQLLQSAESLQALLDHAKIQCAARGKREELKDLAKKIHSARRKYQILAPARDKYRKQYILRKQAFDEVHRKWKEGYDLRMAELAYIHTRKPCDGEDCPVMKSEASILVLTQSILPLPGDNDPDDAARALLASSASNR